MAPDIIETERVVLRPLARADTDALHALWTEPDIRRYLWDDEIIPRERTAAALERNQTLFRDRGFGLWGAWPRSEGAGGQGPTLRGFGGYWFFREPPTLELVYGIARESWGQGLATEVASALARYAFEVLGFREVRASADAPNRASVRVLEKAGFALDRRATVSGLDTVFYRQEWWAFRPAEGYYRVRPAEHSAD